MTPTFTGSDQTCNWTLERSLSCEDRQHLPLKMIRKERNNLIWTSTAVRENTSVQKIKPAFMLVSKTTHKQHSIGEIHTDTRRAGVGEVEDLELKGRHSSREVSKSVWSCSSKAISPQIQSSLQFKRLCARVAVVKESKSNCSLRANAGCAVGPWWVTFP